MDNSKKSRISDDVILGYRDYNNDQKTRKDFQTLDSLVQWLSDVPDRYTETTKEFYDFAEQEYGINAVIDKMKSVYPNFPNGEDASNLEEEVRMYFNTRNECMKSSDFGKGKRGQLPL